MSSRYSSVSSVDNVCVFESCPDKVFGEAFGDNSGDLRNGFQNLGDETRPTQAPQEEFLNKAPGKGPTW